MECRWSLRSVTTGQLTKVKAVVVLMVIIANIISLSQAVSLRRSNNVKQCHFPAIFNFGDSNSDTGGICALYGLAPPPNGETFFGAPAGRFCDGRLIIDFLAESLGLPFIESYLESVGSNFSHGANFATAGSTVRPQNTTRAQSGCSPISVDVQFAEFSEFHTKSQVVRKRGGVFEALLPEEDYFTRAIYTFDAGQNDITAGYKLNMSTEQVKANVPDVVAQLANVVKGVYAQGGRTFWIHNTGPLGCLAYMLDRYTTFPKDKYGCATTFNEVANFYNTKLKEVVVQLRRDLPLAAITYVDVYTLKYYLFTHGTQLGFEKPLVACCGHGGKYNFNNAKRCGSTKIVGGKEILIAKSCKNPSVKVIWDGIHYTEAANKWILDQIINNSSYLDSPISLKQACLRLDHF